MPLPLRSALCALCALGACSFDRGGFGAASSGDASVEESASEGRAPLDYADGGPIPDEGAQGQADAQQAHAPDASLPAGGDCPDSCPVGCAPNTSACWVPSNLELAALSAAPSCGSVEVPGDDTWTACSDEEDCRIVAGDDCATGATICGGYSADQPQVTPSDQPIPSCIFRFEALRIGERARLRAVGWAPVIFVARRQAIVDGTLDASATRYAAGAGGGRGGLPNPKRNRGTAGQGPAGVDLWQGELLGGQAAVCETGGDDSGGGGGGYATGGADGGRESDCDPAGWGGSIYGAPPLVPLVGGSGGASGHDGSANSRGSPGAGGGGGGAIEIVAPVVEISGAITANGAGGAGGRPESKSVAAGGGGGSGGAILIEAGRISGDGTLAAAGGGGGGAGAGGCVGADGGSLDLGFPSGGGSCYALCSYFSTACGRGGDGAYGLARLGEELPHPARPGADVPHGFSGGGGGGGAGYVRINLLQQDTPTCPPTALTIHGLLTCSAAITLP